MILGIGIDIIEIPRIKKAIKRWNESFLERIFTINELAYSKSRKFSYEHLAGRFAAKEAVLKAFGDSSINRIDWKDIEVLNDKLGKPNIRLSGEAKKISAKKKISSILISISHTSEYAVANALLIKNGKT